MLPILVPFLTLLRDSLRSRVALQTEILALRHPAPESETAPTDLGRRSSSLGVALAYLAEVEISAEDRETGDRDRVAPQRLSTRLVLEMSEAPRSPVSTEVQELIRRRSAANPGWGVPRIHGELGELGIKVSETTVAKYMVRHRNPPSQTWRTFLANHVKDLVSADFFLVPTATFRVLFVFVILAHDRRRPVHFAATSHPTAEWTAQQLLQASPGKRLRVFCCATATAITPGYFAKPVQPPEFGKVVELPEVGALHHRYERRAA